MTSPPHSPKRVVQDLYALAIGKNSQGETIIALYLSIVLTYSPSDASDSTVANNFQTLVARGDSINQSIKQLTATQFPRYLMSSSPHDREA